MKNYFDIICRPRARGLLDILAPRGRGASPAAPRARNAGWGIAKEVGDALMRTETDVRSGNAAAGL